MSAAVREMTGELEFRSVEQKDAEILHSWFNDQDNVKFMSTKIRSRNHSRLSMECDILNSDRNYERLWMIYEKNGSDPIVHAGIDDIEFHDQRAEIFFMIGEWSAKGKGYGNEIGRFLVDHAFSQLKLNSLFATATVMNNPSITILRNIGFTEIGIRRQYHYMDGKYYDEILFDMVREDFDFRKYLINDK